MPRFPHRAVAGLSLALVLAAVSPSAAARDRRPPVRPVDDETASGPPADRIVAPGGRPLVVGVQAPVGLDPAPPVTIAVRRRHEPSSVAALHEVAEVQRDPLSRDAVAAAGPDGRAAASEAATGTVAGTELADVELADVDPADVDPADVDSADVDPADVDSVDVDPIDVDSVDVDSVDVDSVDVDPVDVDPADVDSVDVDSADVEPAYVEARAEEARVREYLEAVAANKAAEAAEVAAPEAGTVQDIIRRHFGPASVEAMKIVGCESNFDPRAVSHTNDHGLFQINAVHAGQFPGVTGHPWDSVYDPEVNTRYAKWLYDQQGWRPWTCRKVL